LNRNDAGATLTGRNATDASIAAVAEPDPAIVMVHVTPVKAMVSKRELSIKYVCALPPHVSLSVN
jgi:hypothetical protein